MRFGRSFGILPPAVRRDLARSAAASSKYETALIEDVRDGRGVLANCRSSTETGSKLRRVFL